MPATKAGVGVPSSPSTSLYATAGKASAAEASDGASAGAAAGSYVSESRPVKKRKATYLLAKEEKERLSKEIQALEDHLSTLKQRSGLSGGKDVGSTAASNVVLGNMIRQQQMLVASAQASLASSMRGPAPTPLYSYIHLGPNYEDRRRALLAMRDFKIQNGVNFIEARSRGLDLMQPYASNEHFVDSDGNFCSACFDVVQFHGAQSVEQVFNAACFHFMNEEISLTERLGHVTVRDDYDTMREGFANIRLSSVDDNGVKVETNLANFAKCVDAAEAPDGESVAVFARDSVDVDDLYPYHFEECVRKDQLGSVVITACKTESKQAVVAAKNKSDADEVVIVMRRAAYVKIHCPAFALSKKQQYGVQRGATGWCDAMLSAMRSFLGDSVA